MITGSYNIKNTVKITFALMYAAYLKAMNVKNRKVVLYYHDTISRHISNFRKQMRYIADNYKVVKPSEICSIDHQKDEYLICITIDDAFENVYENALPVLKEYDLPAGVFVPAGNLGQKPGWNIPEGSDTKNYNVMTAQQIIDVDRQGFEVFSHTLTHPRLTEISDDALNHEISASKDYLEQLLGHEVFAISYPHGDHDDRVCEIAAQAGYTLGFTVSPAMIRKSTDSMRIGRFAVDPGESLMTFKLKCSGAFHVLKLLYSLKSGFLRNFSF